jgi:tRNA nucleotidyltransferase (CCA-adding enzyme)
LGQKRALKTSEVYCVLRGLSTELFLFALAKARSQKVKKQITLHLTDYRNVKLNLGGKELRVLGIKPGPQFKRILQETLYAKLDGKVRTKREELNFIKKRYAHLLT